MTDDSTAKLMLAPSIPEWEDHPGDYEALVEDLNGEGLEARLAPNPIPPYGSDLPELVPIAFAIYFASKVSGAIVDRVAAAAADWIIDRAKVRWWREGKVKGVIYGPDGEILKELEWDPPEAGFSELDDT